MGSWIGIRVMVREWFQIFFASIFDLSYCWRIGLLVPDSMLMYLYEPNLSLHSS